MFDIFLNSQPFPIDPCCPLSAQTRVCLLKAVPLAPTWIVELEYLSLPPILNHQISPSKALPTGFLPLSHNHAQSGSHNPRNSFPTHLPWISLRLLQTFEEMPSGSIPLFALPLLQLFGLGLMLPRTSTNHPLSLSSKRRWRLKKRNASFSRTAQSTTRTSFNDLNRRSTRRASGTAYSQPNYSTGPVSSQVRHDVLPT